MYAVDLQVIKGGLETKSPTDFKQKKKQEMSSFRKESDSEIDLKLED